jgi:hypothetical protein
MSAPGKVEAVMRDAFDEVALLIGGTAAVHHWQDVLVWSLLQRLDRVRVRALARLPPGQPPATPQPEADPRPAHPAVEAFLRRNRQGDGP